MDSFLFFNGRRNRIRCIVTHSQDSGVVVFIVHRLVVPVSQGFWWIRFCSTMVARNGRRNRIRCIVPGSQGFWCSRFLFYSGCRERQEENDEK